MLATHDTILERLEYSLVREILGPDAAEVHAAGDLPNDLLRPYLPAIRALSERYREGAETTAGVSRSEEASAIAAYALYYLVTNCAKVLHLLEPLVNAFSRPPRVLDVGSGPATASLGVAARLPAIDSITLVDTSRAALRLGATLLAGAGTRCETATSIPAQGAFDLVLACNVLAELSDPERFVQALLERLAPDGILFILEPGSASPTRKLMALRDTLRLTHPRLGILYPCTRDDACPMRRDDENDWCHGELGWNRPRLTARFDQLLGFNKHRLKFSGLILRQGAPTAPDLYRVIEPAEKIAPGTTATLCGPTRYGRVLLPKRHRTDANRAYSSAGRHDLVRIGKWNGEERLPEEATVELLDEPFDTAPPPPTLS
jgi:SAM-dependent methyltransferase